MSEMGICKARLQASLAYSHLRHSAGHYHRNRRRFVARSYLRVIDFTIRISTLINAIYNIFNISVPLSALFRFGFFKTVVCYFSSHGDNSVHHCKCRSRTAAYCRQGLSVLCAHSPADGVFSKFCAWFRG